MKWSALAALMALEAVLLCAGIAVASRNSSGTFSLFTPGNPVVTGTVGSATWANNTLNDIATSLTDSLDRNGKGGMLAALRGIDGTLAAPAFSWISETGSGLFRNGTNDVRMSIGGSLREQWSSTGVAITGTASVSSTLGVTGTTSLATGGTKLVVDGSTIAGFASLFPGAITPGTTNYALAGDGTASTSVNAPTTVDLSVGGTNKVLVTSAGLTIKTGVGADGSGFKHKRFTGLCSTAAAAGATCDDAVTWTTAFADANYTLTCAVNGGAGIDVGNAVLKSLRSKAAAGFTIRTMAITAVVASLPSADCIAVHD